MAIAVAAITVPVRLAAQSGSAAPAVDTLPGIPLAAVTIQPRIVSAYAACSRQRAEPALSLSGLAFVVYWRKPVCRRGGSRPRRATPRHAAQRETGVALLFTSGHQG